VKGDYVFKGYWNMPEATSRKIRNGWLYTGDLGYLDDECFLYLVGRKSDMIIRGGENVYPQEIENCLEENQWVEEAAVIGVPDVVMGEEVKAFVRLSKRAKLTESELQDFCRSRIAKFKVPKYIDFVEDIPHVAAGKIDRKALRARNSLTPERS
jgi:long-chain acyl-CoA synthetase